MDLNPIRVPFWRNQLYHPLNTNKNKHKGKQKKCTEDKSDVMGDGPCRVYLSDNFKSKPRSDRFVTDLQWTNMLLPVMGIPDTETNWIYPLSMVNVTINRRYTNRVENPMVRQFRVTAKLLWRQLLFLPSLFLISCLTYNGVIFPCLSVFLMAWNGLWLPVCAIRAVCRCRGSPRRELQEASRRTNALHTPLSPCPRPGYTPGR